MDHRQLNDLPGMLEDLAKSLQTNKEWSDLQKYKDLEKQIKEKTSFIQNQGTQITEVKCKLANCEKELEEKKTTSSDLQKKLESERKEKETALGLVRESTAQKEKLTKDLAEEKKKATEEQKVQSEKIQQLAKDFEKEKETSNGLRKRGLLLEMKGLLWKALTRIRSIKLAQREEDCEEATKKLEGIRRNNEELYTQRLDAVNQANEKEIVLRTERERLEEQRNRLEQRLVRSESKCTELEQELSSVKGDNESLENTIRELEDEKRELITKNDILAAEAQENRELSVRCQQEVETIQMQVQILEVKEQAATDHMVAAGEQCVRTEMQLVESNTAVAELKREMEVKDIRLRELQDQLNQLEGQKLSRDEDLRTARLDIADLQNKMAHAETTISGLHQSLASNQGELEQSERKCRDIGDRVSQLQTLLHKKEEEFQQKKLEAERLRRDLCATLQQKSRRCVENTNVTM